MIPIINPLPKPPLPSLRQNKPILNPTTPLQHVRILGTLIPLANNLRAPQLELARQAGLASPLHVFGGVVGSCIGAAHHVDAVQASGISAYALELGDGRAAAGGCLAAGVEGEGFDVGEEDCVCGGFAGGGEGCCWEG